MGIYCDFLKQHPSFLIGIARIFDITGSLSLRRRLTRHNSGIEDSISIYTDWKKVGDDIKDVMGNIHSSPK